MSVNDKFSSSRPVTFVLKVAFDYITYVPCWYESLSEYSRVFVVFALFFDWITDPGGGGGDSIFKKR